MKRSVKLVALLVTVLLLAFTVSALAQTRSGEGRVTIPKSSQAKPGDAGVRFHTNILLFTPKAWKPNIAPHDQGLFLETPASLACIYHLVPFTWGCNPNTASTNPSGGSNTIAIVDAYDDPNAGDDLAYFSDKLGLPPATFTAVYATGTDPGPDPTGTGGWELEESLDIEWTHAMAPYANIILVEAKSDSSADLLQAVSAANNLVQCGQTEFNPTTRTFGTCPPGSTGTGEVVMSWGSDEFSDETSDDAYFTTPGVVYFAAAGDAPGVEWPCTSPNVVCAGGTTTARNPYTGNFLYELTWAEGGGGWSDYEPIPSYQSSIRSIRRLVGPARGVPDLSFDSNPDTGVWMYDSFGSEGYSGWFLAGGTSVASASLAGVMNSAGHFASSSAAELTMIYGHLGDWADFHDITWGICGPYAGWVATIGWDFCTGVGSVRGYRGK
jgi:subtilase family serine protease